MRTLREELSRRAAVEIQMKGLLDDAVHPFAPLDIGIGDMLRAMLYAEMYERNELAKARYDGPMAGLIVALEARIESVTTTAED